MKISTPPKLANLLMKWLLPEEVRDEIIGDFYEEYSTNPSNSLSKSLNYWYQTLLTIGHYKMTKFHVVKTAVYSLSVGIFLMLTVAVAFISNSGDEAVYSQAYWTNGQIHKFFLEPSYWQFFGEASNRLTINLFLNVPSILWASVCICILLFISKKPWLTTPIIVTTSLAMLLAPYAIGVVIFQLNSIPLHESGKIIAFMWLSIWYLILPVSYALNSHIQHGTNHRLV